MPAGDDSREAASGSWSTLGAWGRDPGHLRLSALQFAEATCHLATAFKPTLSWRCFSFFVLCLALVPVHLFMGVEVGQDDVILCICSHSCCWFLQSSLNSCSCQALCQVLSQQVGCTHWCPRTALGGHTLPFTLAGVP